jgi:membrane protein
VPKLEYDLKQNEIKLSGMKFKWIKTWAGIVGKTFGKFMDDRGVKLSAALAYYTIFSLPSLLFTLIGLGGLFLGKEAIQGEIFHEISVFVGSNAAKEIQDILKNTTINNNNILATIIGILFLLISASGIFGEIQDSINFMWGLKARAKKGLVKLLFNRLLSFSMILILGFILLVSLMLNALLGAFMEKLKYFLSDGVVNLFLILDYVIMALVIVFLFAAIFKLLPDAKIKTKDVLVGAIFTSILFFIGKFLIGYYLQNYGNVSAYGTAGSLILIILWVYYTSIILYLGAEFTQVHLRSKGRQIEPLSYAEWVDDKLNKSVEEKQIKN